jgi:flagellar hook-associated protein 1 FlgK
MAQVDPLSIAMSGLANVNRGLAVVSQNITNANTPGYVHETLQQHAATAGGLPMGVATGLTVRDLDAAVQQQLFAQNATLGGAQLTAGALGQIDAIQGKPGSGNDLPSLLSALGSGFSTLLNDPSSAAQQQAVVGDAQAVAAKINAMGQQIQDQRQKAQDSLVAGVGALNADLQQIGALSRQIVLVRSTGGSTADLENQRDAVLQDASQYVSLKPIPQANGDLTLLTQTGLQLPTDGSAGLSVAGATVGAGAYYPGGGLPGIMLGGNDVTAALWSGSIGAAVRLRDGTLPTYQGTLDEFAQTISTRFAEQGLALFSDPTGTIPQPSAAVPRQGPYVGYAQTITVNPVVVAQPHLMRDGTNSVVATPGGPTAFTPNPASGPAGFTDLIMRVLDYSLTVTRAPGVSQPAPNLAQMGPAGTLSSAIAAPPSIQEFATALTAGQSADAASVASTATAASAAQGALRQTLSQQSGVSIDSELATMVQLQNAYAANARVISTMQALWNQLLQSVQ